jgi:4-hydroxy-3-polyprenylbenzoate decarboxylase/2,5-furandicarboxylate decarboxylase 1
VDSGRPIRALEDPTTARPLRTALAIGVDAMRRSGKSFSEVADVPGWEDYAVPELDDWRCAMMIDLAETA